MPNFQYFFRDGLEKINCGAGYDIERDDGLLATLICIGKEVEFLVWHDRFPNDLTQRSH